MKYSFVRKFEKLLVWLFTVRTKVYAASWREGRQTTGQRLGFYSVMITPVKAKHFPTYRLVSSTLQNEHLSTLMDRQKQLLIEVLLESSWIFRLFLVEALRLFCFLFACLSFFFFFLYFYSKYQRVSLWQNWVKPRLIKANRSPVSLSRLHSPGPRYIIT